MKLRRGVVDVDMHPAGRAAHRRLDRVAAQMNGVHPAAGEVALHPGLAFVAHAQMLAHQAAGAVAADEKARRKLRRSCRHAQPWPMARSPSSRTATTSCS